MFINKYCLLAFSAFLLVSINAHAGTNAVIVKKKLPIECTNSEDYDMTDCEKAQQLERWTKEQEKIPANKRHARASASLGEDLLVEKKTGYRIGIHKIQTTKFKKVSIGVKIGVPGNAKMYAIGAAEGCDISNSIDILKNAPEFTFFRWVCAHTRPTSGRRDVDFTYYNFAKRYDRLDAIMQSAPYQDKFPTLTFAKNVYKFRWLSYKQEDDGRSNPIFYDFKITGKRPEDIKCLRTWNDECDIALQDDPLPASQYKILDE